MKLITVKASKLQAETQTEVSKFIQSRTMYLCLRRPTNSDMMVTLILIHAAC